MGYKSVILKNVERLRAGRPVLVLGDGQQALDYVFVDDVVDATLRAFLCEDSDASPINIASGHATTVNDLLRTLCEVADKSFSPEHGPADWTAGTSRAGDPARARERLGWTATTSLREGLRRVWEWSEDPHR
jgi:UDP-glucose 4-epimerase